LLDQSVDVYHIETASDLDALKANTAASLQRARVLSNFNVLVRYILNRNDARIVRFPRSARERRLAIMFGDSQAIPTLDSLSSGQSTLLSIFGTILRYADQGDASNALNPTNLTGIVLIDEIDDHLHADLQHDILPRLIALFPRVQ